MKKEDLRVIKTKKNLYDSLLYLLKDNSFETIKVSDICLKANVNRSTFYDHFSDKYELLNSLFGYIQNDFTISNVNIDNFSNIKDYFLEVTKALLFHFKSNIDVYSSILNNNSISFDMIYKNISIDLNNAMNNYKVLDDIPRKILISYYVPAVISVCKEYLFNPNLYSVNDILQYLDKLITI